MTRISPIYAQGPAPEPVGADAEDRNQRARRTAWHAHGLAVLDPEQIHDDWERQVITNIAERQYGRRKT